MGERTRGTRDTKRGLRRLAWGILLATRLLAAPNELSLEPDSFGLAQTVTAALRQAIQEGEWSLAEGILFEAAANNPANALIQRALGISHYQAGRYFAAASALKRADGITPLDEKARFLLVSCFLRLERSHWAKPELKRLIEENHPDGQYRYTLARIHYDQQRFDAAVEELRKVILQDPRFANAHDLLGQCLEGLGMLDAAEAAYRAGIALSEAQGKPSVWSHYHLGSLLLDEGDVDRAETALGVAVEIDPLHVPSLSELGIVLGKLDNLAGASEALEAAARLAPNDARIQYSLAGIYKRQGLDRQAAEALERFRRLSSGVR